MNLNGIYTTPHHPHKLRFVENKDKTCDHCETDVDKEEKKLKRGDKNIISYILSCTSKKCDYNLCVYCYNGTNKVPTPKISPVPRQMAKMFHPTNGRVLFNLVKQSEKFDNNDIKITLTDAVKTIIVDRAKELGTFGMTNNQIIDVLMKDFAFDTPDEVKQVITFLF